VPKRGNRQRDAARRKQSQESSRPAASRETPIPQRGLRRRLLALAAITIVCVAAAGTYVATAATRDPSAGRLGAADQPADAGQLASITRDPHVIALQTNGDTYRRVTVTPLPIGDSEPLLTSLECQRVHFAAGLGICLGVDPWSGGAVTFDAAHEPVHRLDISGLPSRARVSPDGRLGAMTVFVTGHSYAEGGFSTSTVLIDMATGARLFDLEELAVTRDGQAFQAADFNFWGVTFTPDSNVFYATLATGGKTYLIKGDVAGRTATVIRDNVECPSLSPDGQRLAFKKRMSEGLSGVTWRLHVLDLATMEERPLPELRSVDDQVEWLDDGHLIYSLPDQGPPSTIRPDLWILPLDGEPELVATGAMSPAVVNPGP
jgi:hypothetical protein